MTFEMIPQLLTETSLSERQIWELGNPQAVLHNLQTLPVLGFSHESVSAWYQNQVTRLGSELIKENQPKNKDRPQIVAVIAEPGTGKSTFVSGLVHQFNYGVSWDDPTALSRVLRVGNRRRPIHYSNLEWGKLFPIVGDFGLRVDEKLKYLDPSLPHEEQMRRKTLKEIEIKAAAKIWRKAIVRTLERYYYEENPKMKKTGEVIFLDYPGPRMFEAGMEVLAELYHHKGVFEPFDYNISFVGVVTSADLLIHNLGKRPNSRDDIEADPLGRATMVARTQADIDNEIADYVSRSATVLERDMLALEIEAAVRAHLDSIYGLEEKYKEEIIATYRHITPARQDDYALRLLPDLFRRFGFDTNEIPIFYNGRFVKHNYVPPYNNDPIPHLHQNGEFDSLFNE